jgi:hypothetical protein
MAATCSPHYSMRERLAQWEIERIHEAYCTQSTNVWRRKVTRRLVSHRTIVRLYGWWGGREGVERAMTRAVREGVERAMTRAVIEGSRRVSRGRRAGAAYFLQSSDTASTLSTAMGASSDECIEMTLELSDVVALLMSVSRSFRSMGMAMLFRICTRTCASLSQRNCGIKPAGGSCIRFHTLRPYFQYCGLAEPAPVALRR